MDVMYQESAGERARDKIELTHHIVEVIQPSPLRSTTARDHLDLQGNAPCQGAVAKAPLPEIPHDFGGAAGVVLVEKFFENSQAPIVVYSSALPLSAARVHAAVDSVRSRHRYSPARQLPGRKARDESAATLSPSSR